MTSPSPPSHITVFYDADCPICQRSQRDYRAKEEAAGLDDHVDWLDINRHPSTLKRLAINPTAARRELHLQQTDGRICHGIAAYIILLERLPRWRWLAFLLGLPGVKLLAEKAYHYSVKRRLTNSGRW